MYVFAAKLQIINLIRQTKHPKRFKKRFVTFHFGHEADLQRKSPTLF